MVEVIDPEPPFGSEWPLKRVTGRDPEGVLGIPPHLTQPALQSDCFKELINKLSWALGSTYRAPYKNVRTPARTFALALAQICIRDQGYPRQIAQEPSPEQRL